jgi:hypothetical protein
MKKPKVNLHSFAKFLSSNVPGTTTPEKVIADAREQFMQWHGATLTDLLNRLAAHKATKREAEIIAYALRADGWAPYLPKRPWLVHEEPA